MTDPDAHHRLDDEFVRSIVLILCYIVIMGCSGGTAMILYGIDGLDSLLRALAGLSHPLFWQGPLLGVAIGVVVGMLTALVLCPLLWFTRLHISLPMVAACSMAAAAVHAQFISPVGTDLPLTACSSTGVALVASVVCMLCVPRRFPTTRRPGCCPKCNYDLRERADAGCPECAWKREASPLNPARSAGPPSGTAHPPRG